jgi:hypothetical protein
LANGVIPVPSAGHGPISSNHAFGSAGPFAAAQVDGLTGATDLGSGTSRRWTSRFRIFPRQRVKIEGDEALTRLAVHAPLRLIPATGGALHLTPVGDGHPAVLATLLAITWVCLNWPGGGRCTAAKDE